MMTKTSFGTDPRVARRTDRIQVRLAKREIRAAVAAGDGAFLAGGPTTRAAHDGRSAALLVRNGHRLAALATKSRAYLFLRNVVATFASLAANNTFGHR